MLVRNNQTGLFSVARGNPNPCFPNPLIPKVLKLMSKKYVTAGKMVDVYNKVFSAVLQVTVDLNMFLKF